MKICGVDVVSEHPGGLRTPVEHRPLLFQPITLRGVTARNRIMLGPMSQYLAKDGNLTDWHLVHYGQFAIGGAGIVACPGHAAAVRSSCDAPRLRRQQPVHASVRVACRAAPLRPSEAASRRPPLHPYPRG